MKKFTFPQALNKYERIRSVQEVKEIMKTDLNQYPGLKYNIRKFYNRKVDKSAIQAQCSQCKAKMWFSQNKTLQCFELTQSIAEHEHEQPMPSSSPFLIRQKHENWIYENQQMTSNYQKYYRCLYVTYCWNSLHRMICLSGFDRNCDIKICGYFVVKVLTKTKLQYLLRNFFKNKAKLPETVIFNANEIGQLVSTIFPSTFIYYPPLKTSNYLIEQLISQVLRVSSFRQWDDMKRKLYIQEKELQQEFSLDKYDTIIDRYKGLALPSLPETFVGIGIQSMHFKLIHYQFESNALINGCFDYSQFPHTIQANYQWRKPKKDRKNIKLISILEKACSLVSNIAVNFLAQEVQKSFGYCLTISQPSFYSIRQEMTGQVWTVLEEGDNIACECDIMFKVGLPCSHIIKVITCQEKNITSCVDKVWCT